ncbi:MAG: hypothetical protein ACE5KS_08330 [Woeseiaceae bacterium]
MSYHVDNFFAAVSVLAGHGHIKQRLIAAYEDNLEVIEEDDLPIPVKQSFADLRQLMHRVMPSNGEGPICASVRKMSVDEANQCAQLMVDLYGAMIRHSDSGQESLPLQIDDRPAVSPFLVKSG